ncbi:hypothetical protein J2T60_001705 [Natronospira proteinivora]|uniref:Polyketide cyclase/dehydrase/lipid transport protein n=1 Tax=Natronospira proteinivora TaxID=1807133 RepID=A0ABT1G9X1_9GAMM|nr:hypothetical protein [Natronospira proteinivora]MCP1727705.1 hypothetical protein [Natronospira proteinivora]
MRLGAIGIFLGLLLALVLVMTAFLPRQVERSGEVLLCVERETAFPLFNEIAQVASWSSLIGGVPDEQRRLEGESGEGAVAVLEDEDARWVRLEIVESRPLEAVHYRFMTHQDQNARARVELDEQTEGSHVTLTLNVDFQSFMGRWAIIFIRGALDDVIREELSGVRGYLDERDQGCDT